MLALKKDEKQEKEEEGIKQRGFQLFIESLSALYLLRNVLQPCH